VEPLKRLEKLAGVFHREPDAVVANEKARPPLASVSPTSMEAVVETA
jgi:hypothetical protein